MDSNDHCFQAPVRATHVITGLYVGGAETALTRILAHADLSVMAHRVVTLRAEGPLAERLRASGVAVRSLDMRRGVPNPLRMFQLARWLREDDADVVVTWLYHADLLGGLAAKWARRIPVVWNVRNSFLGRGNSRWHTRQTVRACARLAHALPAKIVFNSHRSRTEHVRLGYSSHRAVEIPNGFDLSAYRPSDIDRADVRRELEIASDAPVVGLVGRFHPMKEHGQFVQAARHVADQSAGARFVLWGEGVDWQNEKLALQIERAGLRRSFRLLGLRSDTARLLPALDVLASSSSSGEGFPNVVGEAMACGVPCAVTDVGDSALVVGRYGRVVGQGDPGGLACACVDLLALPETARRELSERARRRIATHFDIRDIASRHLALWHEIAESSASSRTAAA